MCLMLESHQTTMSLLEAGSTAVDDARMHCMHGQLMRGLYEGSIGIDKAISILDKTIISNCSKKVFSLERFGSSKEEAVVMMR